MQKGNDIPQELIIYKVSSDLVSGGGITQLQYIYLARARTCARHSRYSVNSPDSPSISAGGKAMKEDSRKSTSLSAIH